MKTGLKISIIILLACASCGHVRSGNMDDSALEEEIPDVAVAQEDNFVEVTDIETDNPESWFEIREIDDSIFARIKGKSYKDNCTVPLTNLRYLTIAHYTLDGTVQKGELICNKDVADDMIDIFRNLYLAKYPIERMSLIDEYDADDRASMRANNTSCFNFRVVAGSKNLSKHAYGRAIDLNPLYNPYVKGSYVSPKEGKAYADRSKEFPYKIDKEDLAYKEFIAHGFKWGGDWKSMQDYQHFEK